MTDTGRGVAWILAVACVLVLAVAPKASSDPMPMPEPWAGGRMSPAKSTPVDMVSEDLTADITPQAIPPQERGGPGWPAYMRCDAQLNVRYVLRSDHAQEVAIVFPIVGEASAVAMTANGQALRVRVLPDDQLFAAYEGQWKQVIDAYIAANPRVKKWGAERRDAGGFVDLCKALERRMRMQGLGEGSHMAGWGLAHYLVGDWTRWAFLGPLEKEKGTDVPRRIQLWTEREIAVTVNPATPDPVALWQGAGEVSNLEGLPLENLLQPPMCKMEFAACGLPLKAGSNQVTVSFEQPVGIVGAHMPTGELYGKPIGAISGAVNEFSFILRTARFWRSFGKLNVTVTLPAGTKYAACSLPGAQVNTAGQGGTVTYSGEGLPARNLHVIFAAFQPAPDPDRKHRSASYGPGIAADQAPLGTPPGDLAEVLARVPARGAVPQSALRVGGTVPAGVPVNACLVGGIAGAAVVVGAVALVMVRRRRLV